MKRHALVLAIVALVLLGTYIVGRPAHTAAPAVKTKQTTAPSATKKPATTPPPAAFNKTQYSIDDPASKWVVVNKQRPLQPKDYAPTDLVAVGNGQYMRSEAAAALSRLLTDAKTAGYSVGAYSAYRSYATQVDVYGREVQAYGQAVADSESARPGYSEHQTGWAVDLGSGGCNIADCFGTTPGGKWTTANAYRYGFILRYPDGKTAVTGYRTETWHFRYVGVELATEMHTKGILTLEEFFGLPPAPNY